ncbi:MAG TPA: hypothetical protein VF066_09170 [Thermoleophilaceae bacterium]
MRDGRILVRPRSSWLPWLAFAGIAVTAANLLVLKTGRGLTFYYDEWAFLLRRRGDSLDVFLRPHGEHLSAVPIAIYKAMLGVFGLEYRPYQWMLMVFLIGLAALVYVYGRPRVGPWAALMPVLAILFGGSFWEDTMWPFQIGFIGALACGVGAFIALDRHSARGDMVACALLILAVAQASVGLPFLAGVAFELVLRRDWRRLWVVALPVALYAAWKLAYPSSDIRRENIRKTPDYVYEAAAGAAGSIFGLDRAAGKILLWAGLGLLVDACIRGRASIRIWALGATAVAFWTAAALARAQLGAPDVSRYLLPGATLLMLMVLEGARGLRPNRTLALVLIALVPILYSHGKDVLEAGAATTITTYSPFLQDDYKALQLIRPHLRIDPKTWQLDAQRAPDIDVASYYSLIDSFGDPAPSFDSVINSPPAPRANTDGVMLVGSGTAMQASTAPSPMPAQPPQIATRYWADGTPEDGCIRGSPAGGGANPFIEVQIPPEGIRFSPRGALLHAGVRMFGDDPFYFGATEPGKWYSIKTPPVKSPKPWLAHFDFVTDPVTICIGG